MTTHTKSMLKVTKVTSTRSVSSSESFAMLWKFLKSEQEKQDVCAIQHSHWEDLYRLSETIAIGSTDQAKLRELRRATDAVGSSSPRQHIVFDNGTDGGELSGEKVFEGEQKGSRKNETTAEIDTSLSKTEEKALIKKAVKKKAKKEKKESRKEKKRKRESTDF